MGELARRICFAFLVIALFITIPILAQDELFDIAPYLNESFNQSYVYMDIYMSESGRCFVYGETSENISIPGVLVDGGSIIGRTDWLTSKSESVWSFNLSIPQTLGDVLISVFLPENISVGDIDTNLETLFSVDEGLVISFSGESMASEIFFEYTLGEILSEPDNVPDTPDNIPPESETTSPYFLFIAIALIALAALWILRKRPDGSRLDTVRPTLNDRERMVLDRIIELGGEVKQKVLEKGCNIPKASLSRTLFHMERKGLIKRHKIGINKRIVLGDEYK